MGVSYAEVIGDPIAHSKSPLIHKFWLTKLGVEGDYRATRVERDGLACFLNARRDDEDWRGCNVTTPHKQAVMACLDEIEENGIGAVNCISLRGGRLIGRNTDDAGVYEATRRGVDTDAPICLIGAGGAARAAIASLDLLAVYQFHILARDRVKAQDLLNRFNIKGAVFGFDEAERALSKCAGVINATPLGMTGFPAMPKAVLRGLSKVRRKGLAFDMVYSPVQTPFLERAEHAGLAVVDGLVMLVGQAAHAFRIFFGADPPREHDAELRELLLR